MSMIHLQQLKQAALQMLLHDRTTFPNTNKCGVAQKSLDTQN